MEFFSIKNDFKSHVDEIWSDSRFHDIVNFDRGYAVQDEVIQKAILFIGTNPSFSGESLEKISHFYNNPQEGEIYRYFKKFQDIA